MYNFIKPKINFILISLFVISNLFFGILFSMDIILKIFIYSL